MQTQKKVTSKFSVRLSDRAKNVLTREAERVGVSQSRYLEMLLLLYGKSVKIRESKKKGFIK